MLPLLRNLSGELQLVLEILAHVPFVGNPDSSGGTASDAPVQGPIADISHPSLIIAGCGHYIHCSVFSAYPEWALKYLPTDSELCTNKNHNGN